MGNLAPHADNLMLGKGKFLFKRFSSAGVAPKDWSFLGNCDTAEIGMNDDVLEKRSSMDAAAGILKKITKNRAIELTIKGNDYALKNMALALMGSTAFLPAQTGGAIAGEAVSGTDFAIPGAVYKLANRDVSSVVLKQGATTLVENTDYKVVNAKAGFVQLLESSSTLDDGAAFTADYTAAAIAADTVPVVQGGTETNIEGQLYFLGDPTSGPTYEGVFHFCSFTPDGAVALIQDDWGEWGLKVALQDDSEGDHGGTAANPYFSLIEVPQA